MHNPFIPFVFILAAVFIAPQVAAQQFERSPIFKSLSDGDKAKLRSMYSDFRSELLASFENTPIPRNPEKIVRQLADCSADRAIAAAIQLMTKQKSEPVDPATMLQLCMTSSGFRPDLAMSVADKIVDFDTFNQSPVRVKGFLLNLGETPFLYEARGSTTFVVVRTAGLKREDRKRLLTECSKGCVITVSGRASTIAGNKAIDAYALDQSLTAGLRSAE